jgi:hypothetical protein
MAGDQARQGAVPVQGGTAQCRHPEDVAATQRQRYLLPWAIPALTGAVLVVNARMASSSPPSSPADCSAAFNQDEARLTRPTLREGFGLPSWLAQCRGSLSSLNQSL